MRGGVESSRRPVSWAREDLHNIEIDAYVYQNRLLEKGFKRSLGAPVTFERLLDLAPSCCDVFAGPGTSFRLCCLSGCLAA